MDSSTKWRQCCTSILPKCQSVAHLLHHTGYVFRQLLDLLHNPPPSGPSLTLRIIGVLSRDLQGEIHPYFGDLMESLVSLLLQKDDGQPFALSPELAGSVFRCMGHVFKFNARLIRSNLNVLKHYYSRLLGHRTTYVRRYASEVFALLLRGADSKPLQKHLRFILRRVGRINANTDAQVKEKGGLINGVISLFFFLAKGVKGRVHRKGPAVLRLILRFIERPEVSSIAEREANVLVAKGMIQQLCFHLRSPYSMEFWLEISNAPLKCLEKLKSITTIDGNEPITSSLQDNAGAPAAASSYILGLSHQLMFVREAVLHERGVLLREHSISSKMAPIFYHLLNSCIDVLLPFLRLEEAEDLNKAVQLAWIEANRVLMGCVIVFHSQSLQLPASSLIPGFLGLPLSSQSAKKKNGLKDMTNMKQNGNVFSPNAFLDSAVEWCNMLSGRSSLSTIPLEDRDTREEIIQQLIAFAANGAACNCAGRFPEHCTDKISHTRGVVNLLLWLIGHGGGFCIRDSTPEHEESVAELREPWVPSGSASNILALQHVCVYAIDSCSGELGSEKITVIDTGLAALRCLPYIMHSHTTVDSNTCSITMDRQARDILDGMFKLKLNGSIGHDVDTILKSAACETAGALCRTKKMKQYLKKTAAQLVCDVSTSFTALRCFNLALSLCDDNERQGMGVQKTSAVVSTLVPRMQSRSRAVRLMAARVAYSAIKGEENFIEVESYLPALRVCLELEEMYLSVATERVITSKLSQLEVMAQAGALPYERVVKEKLDSIGLKSLCQFPIAAFVANHCLGLMSAKFSSVWPSATAAFAAIASQTETEDCAWNALWKKLGEVEAEAIGRGSSSSFDEEGGINTTATSLLACKNSDPASLLLKSAVYMNADHYSGARNCCFALDWKDKGYTHANGVQLATEAPPLGIFDDPICDPFPQGNRGGTVPFMASTDSQQLHSLIWRTLQLTPHLLRKHSKRIVSGVLAFITRCYGEIFEDEPHVKSLKHFLSKECNDQIASSVNDMAREWYFDVCGTPGQLNVGKSEARKRLTVMLETIVECGGIKGLFGSDALHVVFFELLTRPESSVASLALKGLLAYKNVGLVIHRESLFALVGGTSLSEELVKFKASWETDDSGATSVAVESGENSRPLVLPEHRLDLAGVVVRLLYGRLLSRGTTGRATPSAHRATVLSFFESLTMEELDVVILMMLRNFASVAVGDLSIDISSTEMVFHTVLKLKPHHVVQVGISKVTGFLNLLLSAVDLLGAKLKVRLGLLWHVLLVILESTLIKEDGRNVSELANAQQENTVTPRKENSLRPTCIKLLSTFLSAFGDDFDFIGGHQSENICGSDNVIVSSAKRMWPPLLNALTALPNACSVASSCPSLLSLLSLMASKPSLVPLLEGCEDDIAIVSGLQCITSTKCAHADVTDGVFSFVEGLVEHENGRLLEPHLQMLIDLFSQKLGVVRNADRGRSREVRYLKTNRFASSAPTTVAPGNGDTVRELSVLKTITNMILKGQKKEGKGEEKMGGSLSSHAVDDLGAVLLELLWNCRKISKSEREEKGDEHIVLLEAYASLVPLMKEARRSWNFLSRILGPQSLKIKIGREGMASGSLGRRLLVGALRAVANRQDMQNAGASLPSTIVANLNAMGANTIEEPDMELRMSEYNALIDGDSWPKVFSLSERKGRQSVKGGCNVVSTSLAPEFLECTAFAPVIQQCLFDLHSTELGIRVGGKAALKRAVKEVGKCMRCQGDPWHTVLHSILIPELKSGMKSQDVVAREGYVAVLANVVQMLNSQRVRICGDEEIGGISTSSPADLAALARPDDPEGDFFSNVVHLQIHRQARAFTAIRKLAIFSKEAAANPTIDPRSSHQHLTPESCKHFLIPLAMHILHERLKPAEHTLVLEATHSLSAMAALQPWSGYSQFTRDLLYQLRRSTLQERSKNLAAALCGSIDVWHFQVAKEGGNIGDACLGEVSGQRPVDDQERKDYPCAVHNILTTKLIPGLEEFLLMETKVGGKRNAAGSAAGSCKPVSVVRPNVAVALIKLLQLLSPDQAIEKVDSLLVSVCSTLRCHDSSVRDTAREALSKMIIVLGPGKMSDIVNVLETSLKADGFQLPVRTFTIAALLKTLEQTGYFPTAGPSLDPKLPIIDNEQANVALSSSPPFDKCVPLMMSLIVEDLFLSGDDARQAANSGGHIVSYVNKTKEAKGAKAMECLQFLGKNVSFRPTHSLLCTSDPASVSSVHALVTPLLTQLVGCESHHINVANEALQRLAVGFADNPTLTIKEALHYIYATCSPFLFVPEDETDGNDGDSNANSDDLSSSSDTDEDGHRIVSVNGWNVVEEEAKLDTENSKRSATESAARGARVSDGRNAPRLTGRDRHASKRRKVGERGGTQLQSISTTTTPPATAAALLSDPAALAAVTFGLTLLNALLKRLNAYAMSKQHKETNDSAATSLNQQGKLYEGFIGSDEPYSIAAMLDPFVMLLMGCVGGHLNGKVTMLALKALRLMSQSETITKRKEGGCSRASSILPPPYLLQYPVANTLRRRITKLLLNENNFVGSNSETISQACLKTLSTLLQMHSGRVSDPWTISSTAKPFGLTRRMFRALLVALQAAPLDTVQAAPWLSLAKAIIGSRVLLPEVYDLMLQFINIAITAGRTATRSVCAAALRDFLKHYPLGQKKLKSHIAKVLQGLSYPHKEGRLSAIAIVENLMRFLPPEALANHASLCFLSLSSRLGSDDSPTCREGAARALHVLLSRVETGMLLSLFNFALQWGKEGKPSLYRTAMQVLGIVTEARPDIMKNGQHLSGIMLLINGQVKVQQQQKPEQLTATGCEENDERSLTRPGDGWESVYAAVCCLEKLLKAVPSSCDSLFTDPYVNLLNGVTANLLYPHAWVRLACCRCWGVYFGRRDPTTLLPRGGGGGDLCSEYLRQNGKLFLVAKQHAAQIDRTGLQQPLVVLVLNNLIWLGEAFVQNRLNSSLDHSCAGQQLDGESESDDGTLTNDNGQKVPTVTVDPLAWVFRRMSFMARPKGDMRRVAVFSWFRAMASLLSSSDLHVFLKCMLLPLRRCQLDSEAGDKGAIHEQDNVNACAPTGLGTAVDVANDVMSLLEVKAGAGAFLTALTEANQSINSSKQRRKAAVAVTAATDPKGAAQAKSQRREQKKRQQRRKREQAALTKAVERGYKRPRGVSAMT